MVQSFNLSTPQLHTPLYTHVYSSKLPQTGWISTTEMSSLTVLVGTSISKLRCQQSWFPVETQGKSIPLLSPSFRYLLERLCLVGYISPIRVSIFTWLCSFHFSMPSLSLMIPITGFMFQPSPEWSPFEILTLITCRMAFLTNKAIFSGFRWAYFWWGWTWFPLLHSVTYHQVNTNMSFKQRWK